MNNDDSLEKEFARCAGALFGAVGLSHFVVDAQQEAQIDSLPLLAWLLASEALVRNDDAEQTWRWLTDQLRLATSRLPFLYEAIHRQWAACWSVPLSIIIFCGVKSYAQRLWESYHRMFCSPDHETISKLLRQTFARYGYNLFEPTDWKAEIKQDSRYATPELASVVKLGLTLKDLVEHTNGDERATFEEWQKILREQVLHRIPARIGRGFAPAAPLFEDLVLAILAVAEWLTLSNGWKIAESVRDMNKRDDERLTADQRVFAGALYGWIQGYRSVGNWIENRTWRSALARQAICLAIKRAGRPEDCLDLNSKIVFYDSAGGLLSDLLRPYITLTELQHQQTKIIRAERNDAIVSARDIMLFDLAHGAFRFRIDICSD